MRIVAGKVRPYAVACTALAASILAAPAYPLPLSNVPPGLAAEPYRPIDGRYEEAGDPAWNTVGTQLRRAAPPAYADGVSAMAGPARPAARALSNRIFAQDAPSPNPFGATNLLWSWGQLLAHDVALAPNDPDPAEAAPIPVPANDSAVGEGGWIPFQRSVYDPATGTGAANPRQQTNHVTGWIDASVVYGSDAATATHLRVGDGSGMLRTSTGGLLPLENGLFLAGDERVNENPALAAWHTLLVREHNRLATIIGDRYEQGGVSAGGDDIFFSARELLTAEVQAVTYNEYLPTVLGPNALPRYDPATGFTTGLDAAVSNAFDAAAFRFGHTQLSEHLTFVDADGTTTRLPLQACFFNPACLQEHGLDAVFRGLASEPSQTIDAQVIDAVRNFLIEAPGADILLDLGAINVQRGRDHGLPPYQALRSAFGLEDKPLEQLLPADVVAAYRDADGEIPDGIDAWAGMISETPYGEGMVGELIHAILVEQFTLLRDGDPFYFERAGRFDPETLAWLNDIRLSDLIAWNTGISGMQRHALFMPNGVSEPASLLILATAASLVLGRRRPPCPG